MESSGVRLISLSRRSPVSERRRRCFSSVRAERNASNLRRSLRKRGDARRRPALHRVERAPCSCSEVNGYELLTLRPRDGFAWKPLFSSGKVPRAAAPALCWPPANKYFDPPGKW